MRRIATVVAASLLLAACGSDPVPGPDTAPSATASCAVGELPRVQEGSHLLGDTAPPVPYSSTPASSGWHTSGRLPVQVWDRPLDDPDVVNLLEGGAVVALHDDRLSTVDLATLEILADGIHAGRLAAAPYDGALTDPLVLVGWGVLQGCSALDEDALAAFVLANAGRTLNH